MGLDMQMKKTVGTVLLDLPPCPGFPRNSEGAFLTLRDGRLFFAYSQFTGDSFDDFGDSRIVAIYSDDQGRSWTQPEVLFDGQEHNTRDVMSVSLLRMKNDDIGLFYLYRHGRDSLKLVMRRSADEGKSWQPPVECISVPGYYVINNDRIIYTSSGRIIAPAGCHADKPHAVLLQERQGEQEIEWNPLAYDRFFYSDDDGYTWQLSPGEIHLDVSHTQTALQEPGLIELKDGRLWSWARTDLGCQYESFSDNGGISWSAPAPSIFTGPASPLSMKRIPWNGKLLAVWNPIPNYQTREISPWGWGRTPLVCAVSDDEGGSWDPIRLVEDDPNAGYCYCAIHFLPDAVLLAYCAGGEADGCVLSRLRIRRIEADELE